MTDVSASAAVGPPPGMKVRLSSNEAPFGPSPAAVAAMTHEIAQAHLYPDDAATQLRAAIADFEGVDVDRISAGTGSAALLMDIIGHECHDGGNVVAYERAFIVYRLGARNAGVAYVEAPTGGPATADRDGYARDPQSLLDVVDAATGLVVIDNPGNPTGSHLAGPDLAAVVAGIPEDVTVVIDEAYTQFAAGQRGYATASELGLEHPRLLVTRTFSKAYALAGVRVGYIVGNDATLVGSVDGWRTRFNVTRPGQAGAIAALGDTDHLARTVAGTLEGRARMAAGLRDLGVPFTDGLGNFLTIELGQPSQAIVAAYAEHGVGVRPLLPYGMTEQFRVTVGRPEEVDAFLEASALVLAGVASRA